MKKTFDGFNVRLVETVNGQWQAYLIGLPGILASGATVEDTISSLQTAWEHAKTVYINRGEPIPRPKTGDNLNDKTN